MIDLNRQLKILMRTGKFSIGTSEAIESARSGRAKIILLSSNCPEPERSDISQYAKISEVHLHVCDTSGVDLAAACGKPYPVSAISVYEPGDSEILQLVKA